MPLLSHFTRCLKPDLPRWFLPVILLLFSGITHLDLHAQGRMLIGISTQIHNTRLMVDLSSTKVKGAYRPSNVVFTEFEFGRFMAFHTGLGYAMMTQNSDAFKNNFHYLSLPLYLKFGRHSGQQTVAFTSFIGTDLHYLLKADHLAPDGSRTDIVEYVQKFQADMVGGLGLKCRLSDRLSLEGMVSVSYGSNIVIENAALMDVNNLNTGYRLNLSYRL
ncbi:MAG: hypothetical protein ACWGNV_08780 [Bacteroidales bacterium]